MVKLEMNDIYLFWTKKSVVTLRQLSKIAGGRF